MNIRSVPWPTKRLRFVTKIPKKSEVRGVPAETEVSFVPMEALGEEGQIQTDRMKPIGELLNGYTYFAEGDVVLAKITPCFENGKGAIAVGLANNLGFGTTELHVLRAEAALNARFLFYVTKSHQFRKLGEAEMYGAGGQKRVPESFIRDFRQLIPPLEEQRAIADFLDRETARIDELIELKRQLCNTLEQQWRATRALAVTPAGRMAETWTSAKLGRFIRLQRGFDIVGAANGSGEVPVISSGGFSGMCDDPICKGPGVVIGRKGTLGTVFYVVGFYWPHSTSLFVVDFKGNEARFVYYFLQYLELEHLDVGAANPTLNRNHVHPLDVDWPDLKGQERISSFLETEFKRVTQLKTVLAKAIGKLDEYRSSLISAAVTGQIGVRNYRPQEAVAACP